MAISNILLPAAKVDNTHLHIRLRCELVVVRVDLHTSTWKAQAVFELVVFLVMFFKALLRAFEKVGPSSVMQREYEVG